MSLVVRLPLLHERGDALFGVFALEQLDQELALKLEPLGERHPEALHSGLLDAAYREGGSGRVRTKPLKGFVEQLRRGHDFVADPRSERILRRHRRTAQHEIERLLSPNEPRQPLRPAGAW